MRDQKKRNTIHKQARQSRQDGSIAILQKCSQNDLSKKSFADVPFTQFCSDTPLMGVTNTLVYQTHKTSSAIWCLNHHWSNQIASKMQMRNRPIFQCPLTRSILLWFTSMFQDPVDPYTCWYSSQYEVSFWKIARVLNFLTSFCTHRRSMYFQKFVTFEILKNYSCASADITVPY